MVGDDDDLLQFLLAESFQNRQIIRLRIEGGAAEIDGVAVGIRRVAAVVEHVEILMAGLLLRKADARRETAVDIELLDGAAGELRCPEAVGLDGDIGNAQAAVEYDGAGLFRAERQRRVFGAAVRWREDDGLFQWIDARGEDDFDRFVFVRTGLRDSGGKRTDGALGRNGDLVGGGHDFFGGKGRKGQKRLKGR